MGFVINGVATGQALEFTQFAGGSMHTIVLTVENKSGGRIMATLDGSAPATVTYGSSYAAPSFFDLTGPGNFRPVTMTSICLVHWTAWKS